MSLPRWWPRSACVYCGRSTRERHPTARNAHGGPLPYSPLACWRHVDLLGCDPEYVSPPHPRLGLWARLWRTNRPAALFLADQLVQTRPVPVRLLARLRVTTNAERAEAEAIGRRIRHVYLTGREPALDDFGMPRDDQREDGEAARERGA